MSEFSLTEWVEELDAALTAAEAAAKDDPEVTAAIVRIKESRN